MTTKIAKQEDETDETPQVTIWIYLAYVMIQWYILNPHFLDFDLSFCPWFCPWFHTISIHFSQAVARFPQEERTGLGGRFEGGSGEEDAGEEDQLMAVLSRQFMIGVDWYGLIESRNSTKSGVFQDSQCSSWGIYIVI